MKRTDYIKRLSKLENQPIVEKPHTLDEYVIHDDMTAEEATDVYFRFMSECATELPPLSERDKNMTPEEATRIYNKFIRGEL